VAFQRGLSLAYFGRKGPEDMLFQQDGVPPHFHKEVTDFVSHIFQEKWIGRGRPVKDAMYVLPVATTLPELVGWMRDAVASVTLNLTMYGLKLNTDIFAGPLRVPPLNICKM
jgi:hypothetical protein